MTIDNRQEAEPPLRAARRAPQVMGVFVAATIIFSAGAWGETSRDQVNAEGIAPPAAQEMVEILGAGVVGDPTWASPLGDFNRVARWESGEWRYQITTGTRRGHIERESLTPIAVTISGETWKRTVGHEYTLFLRRTLEGDLVVPTEIAHAHAALVSFEPPLSYLIPGLAPGERRVFGGTMDVYSSRNPAMKRYNGRIKATTEYAGVYQVTTPAGTFGAALIKTEYKIDILAVVSVRDTLYTFYADGVGKVAEAEHRQISAIGLFSSHTRIGKVLVSFTPSGE